MPLRRKWWGAVAVFGGVLAGLAWVLQGVWSEPIGWWSAGAAVAMGYVLGYTRYYLQANRRAAEAVVLPTLGSATTITLARALCYAMLLGFLFVPTPPLVVQWVIGVLFLVAALTDFVDGYLARITNHVTGLGERLDVEADALGVLVASLLTYHWDRLPAPFIIVGLLYYSFRFLGYVRERQNKPVHPLPYSPYRRIAGGYTVGFFAVVMFPLFEPPATTLAGILFVAPVLLSFGRDGLIMVGLVDAESARYEAVRHRLKNALLSDLPLVARVGVAFSISWMLWTTVPMWLAYPIAVPWVWAWVIGLAGVSVLVVVGWMGRLAAHIALIFLCADLLVRGFSSTTMTALGCIILVMIAGTGKAALWQPEEAVLTRRAGERDA